MVRVTEDMPGRGLKRGDRILTFAYRGEGIAEVWMNGRYLSEFDVSFVKWPDGSGCQGSSCKAVYVAPSKKVLLG